MRSAKQFSGQDAVERPVFTMTGEFFKEPFYNSGIEGIIWGCTELPLLLNDEVSSVPCLDTMKIHIETLIEMIVE